MGIKDPVVEKVVPIYNGFKVGIAQVVDDASKTGELKRHDDARTIDSHPPLQRWTSADLPPSLVFEITFSNHQGPSNEAGQISIKTPNVSSTISDLLNEIKRLQKETAESQPEFHWIGKYKDLISTGEIGKSKKALKNKFDSISQTYSRRSTSTGSPSFPPPFPPSSSSSSDPLPETHPARPSIPGLFAPPTPSTSSLLTPPTDSTSDPTTSPSLQSTIKDRWIINRLQERENEFVSGKEEEDAIRIWVGSWNVNDKIPIGTATTGGLEEWVKDALGERAELIVFG